MHRARLLIAAVVGIVCTVSVHAQGDSPVPGLTADFSRVETPEYGPMLVQSDQGKELLREGRSEMLAFRLDAAEAIFRQLDTIESESPAAFYHITTIALWRALMTEREPWYGRFFAKADSLDERLDDLPDSAWKTHLKAELAFQRTAIYAKQERFTKAAFSLRSAYNGYENNVENHPEFWESYKGMGLCHIAVGSVPRSYRWILNLLGFGGTVQEGFEELELALLNSAYSREEAAVYMAVVDALLNERRRDDLRHVEELYLAYPESPMPAYIYAFLLADARRAADVEDVLLEAQVLQEQEGVDDIPYIEFYLAESLFRQNRFEEAVPLFENYVRSYRGQALVAQGHLNAGLSYEMMGERDRALRHYERISADRDVDSDQSAERRAQQLIDHPLTQDERTLLLGQNLYDGGQYEEAITMLQPVLTDREAAQAHRAEAAYRSARAYHALENWSEASRHYRFAVDNPGDELAKWGPWSQYHLGEVFEAQGEEDRARDAYRGALAYDQEFDYYKALDQRARTALARL